MSSERSNKREGRDGDTRGPPGREGVPRWTDLFKRRFSDILEGEFAICFAVFHGLEPAELGLGLGVRC